MNGSPGNAISVGAAVGENVGAIVGDVDGAFEGVLDGASLGASLGDLYTHHTHVRPAMTCTLQNEKVLDSTQCCLVSPRRVRIQEMSVWCQRTERGNDCVTTLRTLALNMVGHGV